MYVAEGHESADEIWTGADDGMVHLTRDGGDNWEDITPGGIEEGMANSLDLSVHNPGTAFLAYTRYKFNDFTPYIYITTDYGQTWVEKSSGIDDMAHVRVVREDPQVEGLLYAGTERGLFVSWDMGDSWHRLQQNLPVVPITDLVVHGDDLVVATQGRAFWVLDNIAPIRAYADASTEELTVLPPTPAQLWGGSELVQSARPGHQSGLRTGNIHLRS